MERMDKQNTSQLLRIILLFGSIGLLIGLVYFVDRLELTPYLLGKMVFILVVIPMIVPLVIFLIRYALLYQPKSFGTTQNTVNISGKSIRAVNLPIGEGSQSFEDRSQSLDVDRSTNYKNDQIDHQLGFGKSRKEVTNNQIETTATNFLKKTGRYGFIRNDETIINALLYRIQYEYGQGITRERLLDSLSMSHKYMTKDNELINIQEWEADKNDWQHIHNGDTELVGTNARPKQKG